MPFPTSRHVYECATVRRWDPRPGDGRGVRGLKVQGRLSKEEKAEEPHRHFRDAGLGKGEMGTWQIGFGE